MTVPSLEQLLLKRQLVTPQQIDFAWRHISEQSL